MSIASSLPLQTVSSEGLPNSLGSPFGINPSDEPGTSEDLETGIPEATELPTDVTVDACPSDLTFVDPSEELTGVPEATGLSVLEVDVLEVKGPSALAAADPSVPEMILPKVGVASEVGTSFSEAVRDPGFVFESDKDDASEMLINSSDDDILAVDDSDDRRLIDDAVASVDDVSEADCITPDDTERFNDADASPTEDDRFIDGPESDLTPAVEDVTLDVNDDVDPLVRDASEADANIPARTSSPTNKLEIAGDSTSTSALSFSSFTSASRPKRSGSCLMSSSSSGSEQIYKLNKCKCKTFYRI